MTSEKSRSSKAGFIGYVIKDDGMRVLIGPAPAFHVADGPKGGARFRNDCIQPEGVGRGSDLFAVLQEGKKVRSFSYKEGNEKSMPVQHNDCTGIFRLADIKNPSARRSSGLKNRILARFFIAGKIKV
ncbi:hypothetical protein [Sellimonas intestinalis]|uniref:hypothetical protein n=1 Tax=Sellimonas intestinalis TaxID=1653434 RepID=UPI0015EBBBCF|nr:hypothetical protein [Sellimonas intestinalis]MBA2214850.1 hypothetical protein [Sellimonas intestinalis]